MAKKTGPTIHTAANGAIFYGDPLPYPISRAVRAGDFVITSAFGDRVPLPEEQVYDAAGLPLSTGARRESLTFAEEVHGCFKSVIDALALADCSLADVVDSQVWLKDPRDFHEMNRIYAGYFTETRPIRSVFQNAFMMEFRIEMKVVAYKPPGSPA
ncbi:MAG: RidA family protein [bacterium]|nr:RidA family protein [bacterium]